MRYSCVILIVSFISAFQATANGSRKNDRSDSVRQGEKTNKSAIDDENDGIKMIMNRPESPNQGSKPLEGYEVVVCEEDEVMSPDCTCIPASDPCAACPEEYICIEDSVNGGFFCLDCACGACNSLGESCCVRYAYLFLFITIGLESYQFLTFSLCLSCMLG